MSSKNRKDLSKKIRYKFGTIKRFCRIKGLNYDSFKFYMAGGFKSQKIEKILVEEGLI